MPASDATPSRALRRPAVRHALQPPALGEHTAEVLGGVGYSAAQIDAMCSAGIAAAT